MYDLSRNHERLEAVVRDALKSVLGVTGPGASPRVEFYNKFQREMEEHDRDFERKYDEDLNTTLIFVSVDFCPGVGLRIDLDPVLTAGFRLVRSILGRDFGVHHRRAVGPQARLRGNEQYVA